MYGNKYNKLMINVQWIHAINQYALVWNVQVLLKNMSSQKFNREGTSKLHVFPPLLFFFKEENSLITYVMKYENQHSGTCA